MSRTGGEMKKGFARQIYAYIMCVICVGVGISLLCIGIYGMLKIVSPEFTMPKRKWEKIATFQSFKTDWEQLEKASQLTDEELKVRWQDKKEIAVMGEKREGGQNLISMLIYFVIAIPIFLIHWKLAKKPCEE